jgi:hypothetical protein
MWNIQINNNIINNISHNYAGYQIIENHITIIYDTIELSYNKDYKIVKNALEQHIVKYVNNINDKRCELYVYNYGIDNAIILLNNYNNRSKKFLNTNTRSLLFSIFYNYFTIFYIVDYIDNPYSNQKYLEHIIIIIQRFWRKVLLYKKNLKCKTINKDITYLIKKINNEISGEPAKKVLIYLVNKFRRRLSNTLKI